MEKTTYYVIRYNDCYGNGEKRLEAIIKNTSDFKEWLKQHNEDRKMDYDDDDDFVEEHEEEFDIIPLELFNC